jgi:transcriptional regulator with XRE-family HTH domain
MQLRAWRALTGHTLAQVAEKVSLTIATVQRHEAGRHQPDHVTIARYQDMTDGAVRFEDWVDLARQVASEKSGKDRTDEAA